MDWLAENWFWVLVFVLFIVMHMFGHGGHGKHAGHKEHNDRNSSLDDHSKYNDND